MHVTLKGIAKVKKELATGVVVRIHYAYRGGPVIWRSDITPYAEGSLEYLAAFQKAHGTGVPTAARTEVVEPRFRELLTAFLNSPEFAKLSHLYRRDLASAISKLDAKYGDQPKGRFDTAELRGSFDKWRSTFKPREADRIKQGLTKVIGWAVNQDPPLLKSNHFARLESRYAVDRSKLIWTDDDVDAVCAIAPKHVADAVRMFAATGLRPGDLVKLSKSHIRRDPSGDRFIEILTSKRKHDAMVPITDEAAEIIDACPEGQSLFLKPPRAAQWNPEHLSKTVKAWARKAGIRDELHLYDLRGSAVSRLVRAGILPSDLANVMGWSAATAANMQEIYVKRDPSRTTKVVGKLLKDYSGTRLV